MKFDLLPDFRNHLPIRIRFGDGCITEVPDTLAEDGVLKPLLLIDKALANLSSGRRVVDLISARFPAAVIRIGPDCEPTFEVVDAAQQAIGDCDGLVAVGGGSVLDTAKAARMLQSEGASVHELPILQPSKPPSLPLITVPTTAGTGSEVSGGAVISDPDTHRKVAVASPLMRAQYAYVDPELTHGLPPGPTMYGGVDALAQAIAAVVVTTATPVGDAIGLEAARMAAAALPAVVSDGNDRSARRQMACASLMAGLAMNISEVGSEHSLAHPLGSRHGIPHGLSVGLVLAETLDHDRAAVPERFERVAGALSAAPNGSGDGSRAVAAVERLLAEIGFPVMANLALADVDVDVLADDALRDWIPVAPALWNREDVKAAYQRALARTSRLEHEREFAREAS